jgi:hypothetical protein
MDQARLGWEAEVARAVVSNIRHSPLVCLPSPAEMGSRVRVGHSGKVKVKGKGKGDSWMFSVLDDIAAPSAPMSCLGAEQTTDHVFYCLFRRFLLFILFILFI